VRDRAGGRCEREGCGAHRPYAGFLDVHHILGIEVSDRLWTCVALCPNCHREAHYAPDRDTINAALGLFAAQFA
jgi:5-methylcytosine-specific restriction protein A